ncbi:MAG: hypothetical protein MH252_06850 [Thermosynechococcaceae cyanobacterium MS004]|nr:hypothetical protein [Thermosynechococcaceae cyanobacterium MS004]
MMSIWEKDLKLPTQAQLPGDVNAAAVMMGTDGCDGLELTQGKALM